MHPTQADALKQQKLNVIIVSMKHIRWLINAIYI